MKNWDAKYTAGSADVKDQTKLLRPIAHATARWKNTAAATKHKPPVGVPRRTRPGISVSNTMVPHAATKDTFG